MSQSTDTLPALQQHLGRRATTHRWWMLLVGLTVMTYRLRQKHRALFENSLLYTTHEDFEWHARRSQADSFPADFEGILVRVAGST